ncbi:lipopolysaccharide biosynthesis protein [Afifella pfennigii]|uniref:lipopolysaccharide biosynthesis protein n=1 Tax=Afifella pfennigii TaxID=209897 RepID=UPI000478A8A2|nr:oligosaccharide flippase family protein [Afifella pfennigii]
MREALTRAVRFSSSPLPGPAGKALRYTLTHAPWTLLASLSAGLSNYIILLILSAHYGLAAAGQFRLLLSLASILSLFCLKESGKVLLRSLITGVEGVARALLVHRLRWALAGSAAGLVLAAFLAARGAARGEDLALPLLALALLLPAIFPPDIYAQINQARRDFRRNAILSVGKYSALTAAVAVVAAMGMALPDVLALYVVALAALQNLFLFLHRGEMEKRPSREVAREACRESLQLSSSAVLPALAGQADKLLISYFLGLEALGLYTIGISTGRLVLNLVRPNLSIYIPVFVKKPVPDLYLGLLFLLMTAVGIVCAALAYGYFHLVLGPDYIDAYPYAAVLLVGLGAFAAGTLAYYSAVYHAETKVAVAVRANLIQAVAIIAYLGGALLWGGEHVLLLFALSYPLRELVKLVAIRGLGRGQRLQTAPA